MSSGSELSQERMDVVEEFLRFINSFRDETGDLKYRTRLEQMVASGSRSLLIDFDDLLQFNREIGSQIVKNPIKILPELEKHSKPLLASIDPVYASKLKRLNIRIRNLPERASLRNIKTEHLNTLVAIEGIVVRSTPVKSLLVVGRFVCKKCEEKQDVIQSGEMLKYPTVCTNPECARRGSGTFELIEAESEFFDVQEIRLQERPEDLPAGQLPRTADVHVFDDMVDVARPGDRVTLTGIVVGEAEYHPFRGRYRTFVLRLHCNYLEVAGLEEEDITITQEEEQEFKRMSKDAWIFKKLVASVAPSIFGLEDEKEAIILQLLGGNAKELPDGVRIRGDINVFLIGDPGCLVADERIVLGNGAIVKIGQLGKEHLQPLNLEVLTGEDGKRSKATTFHVYNNQPILEIITESGRSIKGTYNHPILTVIKRNLSTYKVWRRLDELKIGDRVEVASFIPCTIKEYIETGFERIEQNQKGRLPRYVTQEFASFCGYVLGKGRFYKDGIGFVVSEPDILSLLLKMVKKIFGIDASLSRCASKKERGSIYVRLSSRDIATNLSFLNQKRVPDIILRSGNEVVSAFLRWLYEADGYVLKNKRWGGAISLNSRDIELLRDVQMLLLRFGVNSEIVNKKLITRRGDDSINFRIKIGFASRKKIELLGKMRVRVPRRIKNLRSERIVKIVRHGRADVYDIEVPEGHRFIANGMISHNTAKSQLLKYVQKIAPRGLYTSGRGTTAAGLTATAVRDKMGGFVLEAGALVLADGGIAAIDEFEKMRPEDRVAIHEAMEQQTCSVAKGGIVATLNTRTAILAAANPSLGRYDPNKLFIENVNLPPTILSRFDLIFVLKDLPDEEADKRLADHILGYHRSGLSKSPDIIDQTKLRKYLSYCKKMRPKLTQEAADRLNSFFLEMRKLSAGGQAPIAITPRQLESLVRLSEARAKSFLREEVLVEDAEVAIALMKKSLIQAGMDVETGQIDVDTLMTGKPKSTRDKMGKLLDLVANLEASSGSANLDELENLAEREGIDKHDFGRLISAMLREGLLYSPDEQSVKRARR